MEQDQEPVPQGVAKYEEWAASGAREPLSLTREEQLHVLAWRRARSKGTSIPDAAAAVLAFMDRAGAVLSREELIDGELAAIRAYMLEQNLPPHFLRLAFEVGACSYLAVRQHLPEVLPMPFRNANGSAKDGDVSEWRMHGHKIE